MDLPVEGGGSLPPQADHKVGAGWQALRDLRAELNGMRLSFLYVHARLDSPPSSWGKGFENALDAVINRIDARLK